MMKHDSHQAPVLFIMLALLLVVQLGVLFFPNGLTGVFTLFTPATLIALLSLCGTLALAYVLLHNRHPEHHDTAGPDVHLDRVIRERTAELKDINRQLQDEIATRRRAEAALQATKDYSENLINSSIDMIISSGPERTIIEFNRAAQEALGYTRDEVIGQRVDMLYASLEEKKKVQLAIARQGYFRGEIRNRCKDGSIFYSFLSASVMHDSKGETIGVMGISRDVTERKIAQEKLKLYATELERSNNELQQFAYVASHDLQEPLRMVTSYMQLLERKYGDALDEKGHKYVGYAVDGAKRMYDLINALLSYSRVSTHAKPASPTDAGEVLGQATANLRRVIKETRATVTHDELPVIDYEPAQLLQLLQNLVGNALKFKGDEPPRINVGCTDAGDHWEFTVSDNGIGIDPAQAPRIFNIFQRLHTVEEYPGTGIGLAVCRKIVERHGGTLTVASEPGRGSVFTFTTPKRTSAGEAA